MIKELGMTYTDIRFLSISQLIGIFEAYVESEKKKYEKIQGGGTSRGALKMLTPDDMETDW